MSPAQSEGPPFGKASIEGVEASGYYRLPVPPRLQKHCRLDLRDLRIHGPEGKELPYLLDRPEPFVPFVELRKLQILKKKSLEGGGSILELEDPDRDTIPALHLEVDQGPVSRSVRIEKSEDLENWEEVHPFQRYHDESYKERQRGFILRDLDLSGARYYRIRIGAKGRGLDPRITEAKVLSVRTGWESYQRVPVKDFQVEEREERTYIRPKFDAPSYRIDGFDLKLEEKDYFYRRGNLARGDPEKPDSIEKLSSFDLTSYGDVELRSRGHRSQDLLIVLKDGDLPNLEVKDVKAYQRKERLLFRTGREASHLLRFGDRNAKEPNYELPHFEEQLPEKLQEAEVGPIEWNGPPLAQWGRTEKQKADGSPYRIWNLIGIISIWLFGVSVLVSIGLLLYRKVI